MKLGSLFDGIGGFPYIAQMYGITPVWASEIETAPISITRRHFPDMKHLGDITKVNGAAIEPVHIVTFGSPCQDLSVAGKRAGLEGERSGLFMEAVRIIREMRLATDGRLPNYAIWENVPGAFSSNGGGDFRAVLEELASIQGDRADIPGPPGGAWADAGIVVGDGYSLAWRVLDAQYMGVPQRRRRIYAVLALDDTTGERAGEILFKPDSERRYLTPSSAPWKRFAGCVESGSDGVKCLNPEDAQSARIYDESGVRHSLNANTNGGQSRDAVLTVRMRSGCDGGGKGALVADDISHTLQTGNDQTLFYPEDDTARTISSRGDSSPCVDCGQNFIAFAQNQRDEIRDLNNCAGALAAEPGMKQQTYVAAFMGGMGAKAYGLGYQEEVPPTLKSAPSGGNTVPTICIQGNTVDRNVKQNGLGIQDEVAYTLNAVDRHAVMAFDTTQITSPANGNQPKYGNPCHPLCANAHVPSIVDKVFDARGNGDGETAPTMTGDHQNRVTDYTALVATCQNTGQGWWNESDTAATIRTACGGDSVKANLAVHKTYQNVIGPLMANTHPGSYSGQDAYSDMLIAAVDCRNGVEGDVNGTLQAKPTGGQSLNLNNVVRSGYTVRRLTPTECERLQGFPDGYTEWGHDGKTISDAARYKALGNSLALPCVDYVIRGILEVAE